LRRLALHRALALAALVEGEDALLAPVHEGVRVLGEDRYPRVLLEDGSDGGRAETGGEVRKRFIGTRVSFQYLGNEGTKQGVLKDRAVVDSANAPGAVPYWDVVDLIEFENEAEPEWIRIGYYRKPGARLVWGSQTTITEPISVWKRLLISTAREKTWFRKLLEDVVREVSA